MLCRLCIICYMYDMRHCTDLVLSIVSVMSTILELIREGKGRNNDDESGYGEGYESIVSVPSSSSTIVVVIVVMVVKIDCARLVCASISAITLSKSCFS